MGGEIREPPKWLLIPWSFIVTVRNEVAKVMFLHLSVSHSVHRGGLPQCMLGCNPPEPGTPPPGSRHPPHQHPLEQTPPRTRHPPDQAPTLPADGYCCGRYASYWNAFLFQTVICFGDIISVQVFTFKLWVFMNSFLFLMPWCPRSDVDVVNAVNMNDVMSSPPI